MGQRCILPGPLYEKKSLSKDIARKPFFNMGCNLKTRVMLYAPPTPLIENGGDIKKLNSPEFSLMHDNPDIFLRELKAFFKQDSYK